MNIRPYRLPPFTMLVAFEAAARHGSFKHAAVELAVTPGAISHQIRSLEAELAIALFHRRHRGVTLTTPGEQLLMALQQGFSTIARSVTALREYDESRPVTIGATTAMSSLWLTPRITAFWREHSHVFVNQHVSDAPMEPGAEGVFQTDLRIRYGEPQRSRHCCTPLFRDTLVPVCSPAFAAGRPCPEISMLARFPLIHLDAESHLWTDWPAWFAALGHAGHLAQATRVNNYTIALQLAREGLGVVLGWHALVEPLIERGVLVVLGSDSLVSPGQFYIEYESESTLTDHARLLCDWLSNQR